MIHKGAVAPESDAGALDLLPPVSEGAAEDRSDAEDSSDAEDASPTAGEDDAADTTEPAAEPAAEE